MIVEGYISFESCSNDTFKNDPQSINWNTGFISLSELAPRKETLNSFVLGANLLLEGRKNNFVKVLPGGSSSVFSIEAVNKTATEILDDFDWGAWFVEATHLLYLRRDIFGTIPLYYLHIPGEFVAFSTSLVSLVKMPVSKPYLEPDRFCITNYLSYRQDQGRGYSSDTFYKHIRTVLPGHTITIDIHRSEQKANVTFAPEKWDRIQSLDEIGKVFKTLFITSVQKCIKHASSPIASHLSGGMDSSSISAVVKILRPQSALHTLYLDTKTKYSDESFFASMVADHIQSVHHNVIPSPNDFEIISLYTSLYGHPECMVISPSSQGSLMQRAVDLGCKSLLIGHDGDSIVGSGLEFVLQTYFKRDWKELRQVISQRSRYASLYKSFPKWNTFELSKKVKLFTRNLIVNQVFAESRKLNILEILKLTWSASREMEVSILHFLKKGVVALKHRIFTAKDLPSSIILRNPETEISYQPSKGLGDRMRGNLPEKYKMAFEDVFNAQSIVASEQFFALSNHYKIQNLFPFYDKDLFEFCVSIPMKSKFGSGIGRMHFREAMKDVLPEPVRTRPTKANFNLYAREASLRLISQSAELMSAKDNSVWEFVDKLKFQRCLQILSTEDLPDYKYSRSEFFVTRTISLAIWLRWLKNNGLGE